jgi:hypothetical protein
MRGVELAGRVPIGSRQPRIRQGDDMNIEFGTLLYLFVGIGFTLFIVFPAIAALLMMMGVL